MTAQEFDQIAVLAERIAVSLMTAILMGSGYQTHESSAVTLARRIVAEARKQTREEEASI